MTDYSNLCLLPCPFCGSEPHFNILKNDEDEGKYLIDCCSDQCHIQPQACEATVEEACMAWNIRALPKNILPSCGPWTEKKDKSDYTTQTQVNAKLANEIAGILAASIGDDIRRSAAVLRAAGSILRVTRSILRSQ